MALKVVDMALAIFHNQNLPQVIQAVLLSSTQARGMRSLPVVFLNEHLVWRHSLQVVLRKWLFQARRWKSW